MQCHAQGNKNCPSILGPAEHLTLIEQHSQERRTFLQSHPLLVLVPNPELLSDCLCEVQGFQNEACRLPI